MKYVMTFEKYQTYNDYQNGRSRWGSPEELKQDAILSLKHMLPTFDEKWIDSIEDVSDDKKGIKFEARVGKDIVHMFKIGGFRGSWEFYLNKKRIKNSELKNELELKNMDELERFLKYAKGYDFYADYIDDGGQWKKATANNEVIVNMFSSLSGSDKKKAIKELSKEFDKDQIERIFKL